MRVNYFGFSYYLFLTEYDSVLEPFTLVIVYCMLREGACLYLIAGIQLISGAAEVAALVQNITDEILPRASHNVSQGRELVAKIIQYLDDNAAWVELYCATGELLIPDTLEIHEELRELFTSLQQVNSRFPAIRFIHVFTFQRLARSRPPMGSPSLWRKIRIPVDIPRMNVSLRFAVLNELTRCCILDYRFCTDQNTL